MRKTVQQLKEDGLELKAYSSSGDFTVSSYIAIRKGRGRVHGWYDWSQEKYIEQPSPK